MHVTLVVLGDLGRSPRMRFHAQSFAEHGWDVDLVGYAGSSLPPDIIENDKIRIRYVSQSPSVTNKMPNSLKFVIKFIFLSMALVWSLLCTRRRTDLIMMQNPPGIPTMAVVWLACKLKSARFVIDWHNYTYSILSLGDNSSSTKSQSSTDSMLVRLAKKWEGFFGRKADLGFSVTEAMARDMAERWSIFGTTILYDRPGAQFRSVTIEEKHDLWRRLSSIHPTFAASPPSDVRTCFTQEDEETGRITECHDRPAILVSSTSWTPDEDFSLLLSALIRYEEIATQSGEPQLPNLVVIITGKGPLKDHYREEMARLALSKVRFVTPWLSPLDYPTLLAAADLGVSLHSSSSGLDLPMKVVDMQGCGLPVLALGFRSIDELISDGENGLLFSSEGELSRLLVDCLRGFPANLRLHQLRRYWEDNPRIRWSENWNNVVPSRVFS